MTELNFPETSEPITTALHQAVDYVLDRYDNILGIFAAGSILRGEGDERSDIDTFLIIEDNYRQRVQKFFNGVRFELFINAVEFIPLYFEEEAKDGGPSTAHMLMTGHIILKRNERVDQFVKQAKEMIAKGPSYDAKSLINERYMLADRFENGLDLRERDPVMGLTLINEAIAGMLTYQFKKLDKWIPRHKDLLAVLRRDDPNLAQLVELYQTAPIDDRFTIAGTIADYTLGTQGFFEWESNKDYLD